VLSWRSRNDHWSAENLIPRRGWLWVSLVIARLWRRRQVTEQDSAAGAAMTWRQRLVLVDWNQGIVCRVVHLITLESIHSVAEELERRAIQVLCSPYSQFHQPTCFWKWGGEPVYSPYWSGVLRWWQCSSFPALQRTTTPRPFPG